MEKFGSFICGVVAGAATLGAVAFLVSKMDESLSDKDEDKLIVFSKSNPSENIQKDSEDSTIATA